MSVVDSLLRVSILDPRSSIPARIGNRELAIESRVEDQVS